ncbi:MAG: hypothetical protein CMH31_01245 [Micavibrio sp.]|nr:hypothetical protein [Micavibrio sp.]|tara:strand:- start:175 stop:513 length:339 start_codon:yes stop_codon:yes gene_type:complete
MSKIDPIKPVNVSYALRDIFNYLDENITELEGKLELAEQSEQDATLTISCTKSALETKRFAIAQVKSWLDQGVELVKTDAVFSEGHIPRYIHSESICVQIETGQLRPSQQSL